MCGIFGIFAPGGADRGLAERGLRSMRHRGPDAMGVWTGADGRLALGHARLKILDLSDSANQPMVSPDGRWALAFNGEIVNFRDVRARYRGPWQFRTSGDSEVLLASFAARGIEAMHDWVGMFAFALVDAERNVLTLVRDRFGIKPLYLVDLSDGGLAFASEIPPLLPLLDGVRADEDIIRTYLETGLYDHSARTFFSGVTALEPGTAVEIDLVHGTRRTTRWYRLGAATPDLSGASERELVDEGGRRIETAIRDHLVADVKVGLNVSGGVDSSVLVAVARKHVEDIHLFTQDYEAPYSEAAFVREVAGHSPLHLVSLGADDILERLERTVRLEAEPFGGISVIGYDALYEAAGREGVTVLLDGNGVDEAFLGYQKYHGEYVAAAPDQGSWKERAVEYTGFWSAEAPAMGQLSGAGVSIDGTLGIRPEAMARRMQLRSLIGRHEAAGASGMAGVKELGLSDVLADKIPRGLRFNDRMSMGRSKELRVPFLDHRVVEFGLGVPTARLLNGQGSKSLFRQIAARWIPGNLAYGVKRSVQSPQREWLRGEWFDLARGLIGSRSFAERGWVDAERAQRLLGEFKSCGGSNSFYIWQWINLELWAREFLD